MAGFLTPLCLEFIDGRNWRVLQSFEYVLGAPDGPERVVVPADFLTDFASIPRGLWNLLPPTGKYGKAAVVHDWLYRRRLITKIDCALTDQLSSRLCDRGEADRILLQAMEVLGISWLTRSTIYTGVRVGGWVAWRAAREREILDSQKNIPPASGPLPPPASVPRPSPRHQPPPMFRH